MIRRLLPLLAGLAGLFIGAGAAAQTPRTPLSTRDSFRIGSSGVLCTAQLRLADPVLTGMFERGYAITCRDAAAPIGALYAMRGAMAERAGRLIAGRSEPLNCTAPRAEAMEGLPAITRRDCTGTQTTLPYRLYTVSRGGTLYAAIGLAGYDPALRLGLRSLVADRAVDGVVEVASTSAGDPAAFARVQAGALDPAAALAQAYDRNNAGSFAEAAEFFEVLSDRAPAGGARSIEYLIGQAMQRSNLGDAAGAAQLFARAEASGSPADPVTARLLRNYRAMDDLNRRRPAAALARLAAPMPAPEGVADAALARGVIAAPMAAQINASNSALERMSGVDRTLLPVERAAILDGQAEQLRGVALRLQRNYPAAMLALEASDRAIAAVRDGRVASAAFMRSEGRGEVALVEEARGDLAAAEAAFAAASQILEQDYPRSAAALAAKARLAGYLARRGQVPRALTLYAEVVAQSANVPGSTATLRDMLVPYFALLSPRAATDPQAAEAMFAAAQVLVRPGVAQTQAVFARELSAGDDQAASLFRQSVTLSRQVARASGEVARLSAAAVPVDEAALATARVQLAALEQEQTGLLSRLSAFPRYRVLAPEAMTLAQLRAGLRAGEAYYMLRGVGRDLYAMLVTPTATQAFRVPLSSTDLAARVATLRASVVTDRDGRTETYPFDLPLARQLYVALFGPLEPSLRGVTHLIYEPDGPMLQLPATLLVTDDASVARYGARQQRADADPYDYRRVAWLGRDRRVTTAVSPQAFMDVRSLAPSKASNAYLGLGHNAPPATMGTLLSPAPVRGECDWPLEAWQHPIAATELQQASTTLGRRGTALLTGAAFTDTALKDGAALGTYRILHFATHGLVTAPRPQCPARPALMTSFGDANSDGLLSFREIFDLRLDADVVILSACDTAGMATIEATREAGVTTGGNFALDGLVRAFVGAGARSVIASHWPIPDDYGATKQMMESLFAAAPGTPMAAALQQGQRVLMDRAETSHPFYWAAFAIIGDGEQPLVRK